MITNEYSAKREDRYPYFIFDRRVEVSFDGTRKKKKKKKVCNVIKSISELRDQYQYHRNTATCRREKGPAYASVKSALRRGA